MLQRFRLPHWGLLGLSLVLTVSMIEPVGAASISWRVENPFRFFLDADATDVHRRANRETATRRRGSPILNAERWLSKRSQRGWAEPILPRTCWHIIRQGHTECGGLDAYVNPRSHRVVLTFRGAASGAVCDWSLSTAARARGAAKTVTRDCSQPVVFDVPFPAGATASVRVAGRSTYTTRIEVQDRFVVGVGDSYASGDGNPDRPVVWRDDAMSSFGRLPGGVRLDGYPQRVATPLSYKGRTVSAPSAFWLSQPCHRSLYSNQLRVALQLALEDPHRAVTYLGVACSSATITRGLLVANKGVERFPFRPKRSQIGQVAVAQCGGTGYRLRNYASAFTASGVIPELNGLVLERCPPSRARKIDLVLLSAGGNDIGFANLVSYAILRDQSPLRRLARVAESLYTPEQARRRFPELRARYRMLRRAIHNHLHVPWDEADRIVLTAYPPITIESDGHSVCPAGVVGMEGFPGYRLDKRRAAEAERIGGQLVELMAGISQQSGWQFVQSHRRGFHGRGICAGTERANYGGANQLRLPRWNGQSWQPYLPSTYLGYSSRDRWIRTANDAFMMAHVKAFTDLRRRIGPRSRRQGYGPTDLLEASTFGGAFHPTAEGHAAIADAVLPIARRTLEKYDRGGAR